MTEQKKDDVIRTREDLEKALEGTDVPFIEEIPTLPELTHQEKLRIQLEILRGRK